MCFNYKDQSANDTQLIGCPF